MSAKLVKTKYGGRVIRRKGRASAKAKPKTIKLNIPKFSSTMMTAVLLIFAFILLFITLFVGLGSSEKRIDEPYQDYNYEKNPDRQSNNMLEFLETAFETKFVLWLFMVAAFIIIFTKFFSYSKRGIF